MKINQTWVVLTMISSLALSSWIHSNKLNSNIPENVVFVLDVSTSMLAKDFEPNRLEAVKDILKKIVKHKDDDQQMAIVVFAKEAMLLCPLTEDTDLLFEKIKLIEAGKLKEDGTAIGAGVMLALSVISKDSSKSKSLVLLTDGINNIDEYSPYFAALVAKQQNVQIHSFGIGCNGKALTPLAKKLDDYVYGQADVKIDEELLKSVGHQTQGNYQRITYNTELDYLEDLNQLLSNPNSSSLSFTSNPIPQEQIDSLWKELNLRSQELSKQFLSNNSK